MKTGFFLLAVVAMLALGCSEQEPSAFPEIEENYSSQVSLQQLLQNEDFRSYVETKLAGNDISKAAGNNGNGIIFMNGGGAFYGFGTGSGFIFFSPNDKVPTMKIFPNGTAAISLNSDDVSCFWFDISEPISFGNTCYEEPKGHLNVSYRGQLEVDETPFGTFYSVTDPFENAYTFKASNVLVSNETVTFDEETETETCNGDATVEKAINFKIVRNGNKVLFDLDATETSL